MLFRQKYAHRAAAQNENFHSPDPPRVGKKKAEAFLLPNSLNKIRNRHWAFGQYGNGDIRTNIFTFFL
jgi:hypothetical protein